MFIERLYSEGFYLPIKASKMSDPKITIAKTSTESWSIRKSTGRQHRPSNQSRFNRRSQIRVICLSGDSVKKSNKLANPNKRLSDPCRFSSG
jgi:hypothetical protein